MKALFAASAAGATHLRGGSHLGGNALRRLEQGGFLFELTPAGKIAYRPARADDDVPEEWAGPLLDEISRHRQEVVDILEARQEWVRVYDEWVEELRIRKYESGIEERIAAAGRGESPRGRDEAYLRRLVELAMAGQLPCYDGGEGDQGAAGWNRVAERIQQSWTEKENNTMGIKIEQTTYAVVPMGEYRARITGISQVEGKFGTQLQFKCEIADGVHAGTEFLSWCNPVFSPKSRLYQWVEAALGVAVPKDYTFDSDNLIGREIVAVLVVRELDGGGEANRVDRVRGVGAMQKALGV